MLSFHRPPVSSRAALTEIERQRRRHAHGSGPSAGGLQSPSPSGGRIVRAAADKEGASGGEPKKKGDKSKGSGQKDDVQRKPEDQKGRADPKEGEGRGAY